MKREYETVIGLEVHVELATKTKIFCGCSTEFGGRANTQICPVCAGMPGALPVLNKQVVEYALGVGMALHCQIAEKFQFDRKNYFYPDNPQNYQISQLYHPICRNGYVEIQTEKGKKKIGIHEMHMEEDAGKLIHDEEKDCSYIDYNRAGVPLIEIVSEPDMKNAEEVIAYLEKLKMYIRYLGVSDCKLQEGSMRVDVNLSVNEKGSNILGTRTEMKNLNSFRAITRAIEGETIRQISLLESGKKVELETRRWDDGKGMSYSMRSKEDARDYRYFKEPDLPSFFISEEWIQRVKERSPEFREDKMLRFKKEYEIPEYDIEIMTESKHMSDIFEETVSLGQEPKKVSNWLIGETMRLLKEKEMEPEEITFSPMHLAELIDLVNQNVISNTVAKKVFQEIFEKDINPQKYVEEKGLSIINDERILREKIQEVLKENIQSVQDYRNGKERAMGFLIGQTMKSMGGKANPSLIQKLLKEQLTF